MLFFLLSGLMGLWFCVASNILLWYRIEVWKSCKYCRNVFKPAYATIYVETLRKKCRKFILNLLYWSCASAALNSCAKQLLNNYILSHCTYTIIVCSVFNTVYVTNFYVFYRKNNVWAFKMILSVNMKALAFES